jgi:alkanesulfonate monooxygenase SsuD/methylene tetrahydromethanopterin reductase-like flavin-dependent oxidoreductase (luciferase family)
MITVPNGHRVWGMQLPIQAQSSYFVSGWEQTSGPTEMAAIARAADRNGCFYLGVCDHVALPESVIGGMGLHWADPISTLGWLGGVTEHVGLLTHVYVLPYRHPLMAAKQFATLDHLSNGRAICGIGAGHVQAEFEKLGVDFHTRGKAVDAGVPVLAAALADELLDGFGIAPRPTQSPRPPIWIAGSSPAAVKRAGRLGDGWLPQGPSNPDMVAMLNESRAAAGRDQLPTMIGHITAPMYIGTPDWDFGAGVLTGSPDAIAEQILSGTAPGVNQLQVRFKSRSCAEQCEQIEAFATTVFPLLENI